MTKHTRNGTHEDTAQTWCRLDINGDYEEGDVLRAANMTGMPVRIFVIANGKADVELYCTIPDGEIRFRQALIDQRLRREIEARSSAKLAELVDAVIGKVTGA